MTAPRPKSTILDIAPYVAGRAKAVGFAKPIKLSANENPLGCSEAARAAYVSAAAAMHHYPDPKGVALREAIAAKYGLDAARIVLGAGSDELFSLVCQAFLSSGENMVQPQYAFAAWAIAARAAGAAVKSAPEHKYRVDVDALLAMVDASTRVVFIANPANPTGTFIPFAEVERLHRALPANVVLVLDAAYGEFAEDRADYEDGLRLARTKPNVVLTRTFSKLHGLASLRVGWAYAAQPIVDVLNRIRLPFNTSTAAQAAAVAALGDEAFVARSLALAKAGRERLASLFVEAGFEPLPSAANFVTALNPAGAEAVRRIEQGLAEQGVLVRGLANYGLPHAMRISVGADSDFDALTAALRHCLG